MKKGKLNRFFLISIFTLTFVGYYAILLLLFNVGLNEISRQITIPIRLIILLFIFFYVNNSWKTFEIDTNFKWFVMFALAYIFRLFFEEYFNKDYYITIGEVLLYFLSFSVFPFVGMCNAKFSDRDYNAILKSILWSGLVFGILAMVSYGKFIGQVGRLTSGTVEESVISPLALSYTASLVVGCLSFYLFGNSLNVKFKWIFFIVILLNIIPFFLGSSRGSLFSLFIPFLLYIASNQNPSQIIKSIFLTIFGVVLLVFLDDFLGSGLLDRFLGIGEAIDSGSSSAIRLEIWKTSFAQFLENPIFGDSIVTTGVVGYPHNIIIEVLQSTGILGFIPFLVLIINSWKIAFRIFFCYKTYMWVAVIFIQAFFQSMFSGSIFTSSWLWLSMAILFIFNNSVTYEKNQDL